jgi:small GTP-binding protein
MNVKMAHMANISELVARTPAFSDVTLLNIAENDVTKWTINGETGYCIQVMFIGKTGYGKSTTLNKLCGQELFKTDSTDPCTKTISSALYKIHNTKNYFFSLCDLPGLGESTETDKTYIDYYHFMLKKSHCVVYVLRADTRDYSLDLEILKPILENNEQEKKFILAVNFVDKIEPISRSKLFRLNQQQLENIEEKSLEIQKIFKVPQTKIIFYSATEEYNIDKISKGIIDILEKTVKPELKVADEKLIKEAKFKTALKFAGVFLGGAAAGIAAGTAGTRLYDHLKKKK